MKRLLFSIAMSISVMLSWAQYSGSGSGTQSDPYKIFYADQLNQVRNFLNQDGVVFKLMNDIDLSAWLSANNPGQGWEPIGVEGSPFKGVFIGNDKTISGFYINRTSQNVGLFGYTSGATIQNLTIEGNVTGGKATGGFVGHAVGGTFQGLAHIGDTNSSSYWVGGIIGHCESATISNVSVTGNVTGNGDSAGGIVGSTTSSITNASMEGNVSGLCYVGGIAGWSQNTNNANPITNATVVGNITGGHCTGGIVGNSKGNTLSQLTYTGTVSGTYRVGGIVGQAQSVTVSNARASHTVMGTSEAVGGVCGYAIGTSFSQCYSYCNVSGTNYIGGIVGQTYITGENDIIKCLSFGNVSGNNYVGGIIGRCGVLNPNTPASLSLSTNRYRVYYYVGSYLYKDYRDVIETKNYLYSIKNCYAVGSVSGRGYIGGICGEIEGGSNYTTREPQILESHIFKKENGSYYSNSSYYYYYLNGSSSFTAVSSISSLPTFKIYSVKNYSTSLTDNYFNGDLTGGNYVGGVVGSMSGGELMRNYSNARISGTQYVGGIVGKGQGVDFTSENLSSKDYLIIKSNMSVNQSIVATSAVGRIYGSTGSYVTVGANGNASEDNRSLYDTQVVLSGVTQEATDNAQNGVSNGIAYFKLKANYVGHGWDFNDNWTNQETETFPYKPWQAAPPTISSELVSGATSISGQSTDGGSVHLTVEGGSEQTVPCSGTSWTLSNIAALKSGKTVSLYTTTSNKEASYRTLQTVGYPGSGTEDDPWRVYTADDLQGVYKAGYYKQMNDINLTSWINENSSTAGWVPVGFAGTGTIVYDGGGHKVTNLWVNREDLNVGLFSSFNNGIIRNLTVEASSKQVKGTGEGAGILIGRISNSGTIENVVVKGNVSSARAGGVVGLAYNTTMRNVSYEGKVTAISSNLSIGGIIGAAGHCTISNCNSNATLVGGAYATKAGGIAGGTSGGSITDCRASGSISSSARYTYLGGLVGNCENAIERCVSDMSITSTGADAIIGGLIGVSLSSSSINKSYSTGTVSATGANSYVGGLVGQLYANIQNCYSSSDVTGTLYTAGLVAYNYGSVDKCYASGDVESQYYGSGLVGYNDGTGAVVTNSVALGERVVVSDASGWGIRVIGGYKNSAPDPDESNYAWSGMQVSVNGVPKIISDNILDGQSLNNTEIHDRDSYEALYWDFSQVWSMNSETGLPCFLWDNIVVINLTAYLAEDGSGDYYCTYYNEDNDLVVADNLAEAYTATVSGNTVTLTPIEGGVILAGTPVVLRSTQETITLNSAGSDATVTYGQNDLLGTAEPLTVSKSDNIYGMKNGNFYLASGGTIPANRAYLQLNASAGAPSRLDMVIGEATALQRVQDETNAEVWYTISGVRVERPSKAGIYIKNGRKVLVK